MHEVNMPFDGPNDPELPSNVKKKTAAKRRQWVAVFNSSFAEHGDEGRAIRAANGVTKEVDVTVADHFRDLADYWENQESPEAQGFAKAYREAAESLRGSEEEVQVVDVKCQHGEDEKCHDCMVEASASPYSSVTTFTEYDRVRATNDQEIAVETQISVFDLLQRNIWRDDEIPVSQKITKIQALLKELSSRVANPPEKEVGLVGRIMSKARKLVSGDEAGLQPDGRPFFTKEADGSLRWLTVTTNIFEDRDREIFSEKAHEDYVEWADRTKSFPELLLWHTPGARIGPADFVAYSDGFIVHAGTVDKDKEAVAESLRTSKELIGVSHGFRYDVNQKEDGVYGWYRTYEVSVLPWERAANQVTTYIETGRKEEEEDMGFKADKRAFLVDHYGEENTTALEGSLSRVAADLKEEGVNWKELQDLVDTGGDDEDKPADGKTDGEPAKEEKEPVVAKKEDEQEPETKDPEPSENEQIVLAIKELATQVKSSSDSVEARVEAIETRLKAVEDNAPRAAAAAGKGADGKDGTTVTEAEVKKEFGIDLKNDGKAPESPAQPYLDQIGKGLGVPQS